MVQVANITPHVAKVAQCRVPDWKRNHLKGAVMVQQGVDRGVSVVK